MNRIQVLWLAAAEVRKRLHPCGPNCIKKKESSWLTKVQCRQADGTSSTLPATLDRVCEAVMMVQVDRSRFGAIVFAVLFVASILLLLADKGMAR